MLRSFALLLAVYAGPAMAAEQQRSVPPRFQGEWNASPKRCGTDMDDSRLTITASRVRFYESGGPIRAIVTQGSLDVALISEVSGEGSTQLVYHHFRLSADHAHLTDVSNGAALVRHRCVAVPRIPGARPT